jgi:predicted O-methyltransferase YrrM
MDVLEEILRSKQVYDAEGKAHRLHSGLSKDEVNVLMNLCKDASLTVEVGMAYGVSSMAFALAHLAAGQKRGIHHVAIDPFQSTQWHNIGRENLKRIGYLKQTKVIEAPSYAALPAILPKLGGRVDVVLVDGWHTFDATLLDAMYAIMLLRMGGYLIIDDMWMPAIRKVARYISTNYKHMKLVNQPSRAFIVFQKVADDSRDWNYHVDF